MTISIQTQTSGWRTYQDECNRGFERQLVTVVFTKIAVMIAVPVMVVLAPSAIAFPVPGKEAPAVVVWNNPTRAGIWRTSPVSGMPLVVVSHGIPISFHPYELGAWTCRENPDDAWWRWRPDLYPYRHLTERACRGREEHRQKQDPFHRRIPPGSSLIHPRRRRSVKRSELLAHYVSNNPKNNPSNERGALTMSMRPPHPDSLGSTSRSETSQPPSAVSQQTERTMSDESFLRYRLEVVRRMPEGDYKRALVAALSASLAALRGAGSRRQPSCGNKLRSICVSAG